MRTSQKTPEIITTIGIDLGENTFHLVGLDKRGAIRSAAEGMPRSAWTPPLQYPALPDRHGSLLGLPSHRPPVGSLGHDVRLIPAQYVKPFLKGSRTPEQRYEPAPFH